MGKLKKIFTSTRVIVLLAFLLLSLFGVLPSFSQTDELAIRSIGKGSAAELAGIDRPTQQVLPRMREILISINDIPIHSIEEYASIDATFEPNQTVKVVTKQPSLLLKILPILSYQKKISWLTTQAIVNETIIGYKTVLVNKTNETTNETYSVEEEKALFDGSILGTEPLGFGLSKAANSNVRLGLDLEGGTRVMLAPEEDVSENDMSIIIENLNQRLNLFGLSDISIKDASDLDGNKYIIVEVPGANDDEVKNLIGGQGKFEAKIGDDVAFTGGDDLKDVCRRAECAGIDINNGCGKTQDGSWSCRFRFSITLSLEAADRMAGLTNQLDVEYESGNTDGYLSKDLDLYMDDELVDSLRIGGELKGQASTDIAISGGGTGVTQEYAIRDALTNMKQLQTVLVTGSLPVKLDVVKTDAISPVLGEEFINNALLIALFAIGTVALIILIRYRSWMITIPMALTMLSEVVMILGLGSVLGGAINWNLDLSSIAGIIIVAGTSVDHLVVITDSVLKGENSELSWKQKVKNAFSVIMIAYLTTATAMLFLIKTGGGLLKGFAVTTILGLTIGVLIARPAFAAIIKILLKE